jgi:Tfp pilus assembly protein PilN
MIDINLLPPKSVLTKKNKETRRLFFIVSAISSVLFTLILGTTLLVDYYFSSSTASVKKEFDTYQERLSAYGQLGWYVYSIHYKLTGISAVERSRKDLSQTLKKAYEFLPEKITLSSLQVKDNGLLSMNLSAKNRVDLEDLLSKFSIPDGQDVWSDATLSQLQLSGAGEFSVGIDGKYFQENK